MWRIESRSLDHSMKIVLETNRHLSLYIRSQKKATSPHVFCSSVRVSPYALAE